MAPEQVCDDFHEISHRCHQAHWKAITEDQNWRKLVDSWFDTKCADTGATAGCTRRHSI
jgi:hypothetical protein